MTEDTFSSSHATARHTAIEANRWVYRLTCSWLPVFTLVFGLYVGLPFLAPVFMTLGLEFPARAIYTIYSYLCHQLPQRSFFLFGPQLTYSLAEITTAGGNVTNLLQLREFIGSQTMGWKVAWSDRMVSMYFSILVFAWVWYPLRKHIRQLHWKGFALLLLPMAIDGFTHMVSDFSGISQGFRYTNHWLAALTNNALPNTFYLGDGWGSFNALMRLFTGISFGLGVVWFGFPYLDAYFRDLRERIQEKFVQAGHTL